MNKTNGLGPNREIQRRRDEQSNRKQEDVTLTGIRTICSSTQIRFNGLKRRDSSLYLATEESTAYPYPFKMDRYSLGKCRFGARKERTGWDKY